MVFDNLIAKFGSFEFYFDVTLLVAIAGVVWTFARKIAQELYFLFSLRTYQIELELNPKGQAPQSINNLNVLVIRYGNEKYLEQHASDRERHHGRLQNKIVRVVDRPTNNDGPVRVKLKVHKRLGTQFKFFVDVSGDPKSAVAYLESHESVSDVFCKALPKVSVGETKQHRIFFLVNRLDTVKTVEGIVNNFIFPV